MATLEAVVQQANNGRAGDLVLAERRHARADWQISEDHQSVSLTLHQAWGGQPLDLDTLLRQLLALGVARECVSSKALAHAVSVGSVQALNVARGRQPKRGQDARFIPLVTRDDELTLEEDAQGRVDLYHLHDFVIVEPGTALLRREPATTGEAGMTVLGEPLASEPGRDRPFDREGEGAGPDPDDPNVLCATLKGHPVFTAHSVSVDRTLRLKSVDLTTGNIDFDGSVEVAGDVISGFTLKASGDVFVRGIVERADVRAGGSLTILGGVMGEEVQGRHDGDLRLKTHLVSGGTISAKFISLAYLHARADILVREYVLQSQLLAGRDVQVGQPAGKGSLMGGSVRAGRALVVNQLGSEAGVATEVMVGRPNRKRRLLEQLKDARTLCEHNWQKINETLDCIQRGEQVAPEAERLSRLYATRDLLGKRRQRIVRLIDRLTHRRGESLAGRITVKKHQFANISANIDGVRRFFNTEQGPANWLREGVELRSRP